VGILAAAEKVIEILGPVLFTLEDAPRTATTIYSEVNNSRVVLSAFQTVLRNLDTASRDRTALIQIDQIVTVLTDGVILFSDLESFAVQLETPTRFRSSTQWTRREETSASLLLRLQGFKISVTSMLDILEW
jgi:hypothetical protein